MLDLKDEDYDVTKDVVKQEEIALALKLDAFKKQKLQLDTQKEYSIQLAEMNALLDVAKKTQADINQLASGYSNAIGDIVTNIGEIISQRGGFRTILQPFADAYITSVTTRLSDSLQGYLDDVLGASIGSQLNLLEKELNSRNIKEPYEIGGEVLKFKIIESLTTGGDYLEQSIIDGITGATISIQDPTGIATKLQNVPESTEALFNTEELNNVEFDFQIDEMQAATTAGANEFAFVFQSGAYKTRAAMLEAFGKGSDTFSKSIASTFDTVRLDADEVIFPATQTEVVIPNYDFDPMTYKIGQVNTGVSALAGIQTQGVSAANYTTEELIKQVQQQRLTNAALQGLGSIIGNLAGGGTQEAGLGASIGGIAGSFWGPVAGAIGSVLGGVIGGLFGGDDEPEPEPIKSSVYKANSDALRQNTEALIRNSQDFSFMKRLLNAPANFVQPAYSTLGGGGAQVTVNINAPVGNEQAVGQAVYNAVSKVYANDNRRIGRRG